MDYNGIKDNCTVPYHLLNNGLAERAVQTFKKSLHQIATWKVGEREKKFCSNIE